MNRVKRKGVNHFAKLILVGFVVAASNVLVFSKMPENGRGAFFHIELLFGGFCIIN